jgi:hypothetical protein
MTTSLQVKALASHGESHTIVIGTSAGTLVTLDQRYGILQGAHKAHETGVSHLLAYRDHLISAASDRLGGVATWQITPSGLRQSNTIGGFEAAIAGFTIYRDALFIPSGKRIGMVEFGSSVAHANMVAIQDKQWPSKGQVSACDAMQCHNLLVIGCDDGSIRIM